MPDEHDSASLALRTAILSAIAGFQGVKSTELVAKVVLEIGGNSVDAQLAEMLDKLIEDGEIIEIEYILPEMPYRVKSFLLPKGCKLRSLRNGKSLFMFTPDGDIDRVP